MVGKISLLCSPGWVIYVCSSSNFLLIDYGCTWAPTCRSNHDLGQTADSRRGLGRTRIGESNSVMRSADVKEQFIACFTWEVCMCRSLKIGLFTSSLLWVRRIATSLSVCLSVCISQTRYIVRASSVSLFRKLIDTVDLSGYCRY